MIVILEVQVSVYSNVVIEADDKIFSRFSSLLNRLYAQRWCNAAIFNNILSITGASCSAQWPSNCYSL
jgi:hypothetical protein